MPNERLARLILLFAFGLAVAGFGGDDFVWAQTLSDEKPAASGMTEDGAKGTGTSEPAPPAPADNTPPAKGFKPSEKIGADSVVSFPVDI